MCVGAVRCMCGCEGRGRDVECKGRWGCGSGIEVLGRVECLSIKEKKW